jgi:CHAT domain-containing protein/tetratricopeptide (TPR) repeat protein
MGGTDETGGQEEFIELAAGARGALQAGDTPTAIEKYRRALDTAGPHVEAGLLIVTRLGLADAYRITGKLAVAAELTDAAVSDALLLYGSRSVVYAEVLNDAAVQKHYENDFVAARHYYEQAISIYAQVDAPAEGYATSLANLAGLLSRHFQEFAMATELMERSLAVIGEEPDTAPRRYEIMEELALHYNELGYHDERVISLLREVVEYKRTAYGAEAVAVANSLVNLGHSLEQAGDYSAALSSLIEARRIYAAKIPAADVRYARACRQLGSVRGRLGNFAAAAALYREADAAYTASVGESHAWTLQTRLHLALTLGDLGRTDEAANLLDAVADGYRQEYGEHSRDFARVLHERGTWRLGIGDLDAAEKDLRRAAELRAEILGTGAYDYAITLNSQAELLAAKGDLDGAIPLLRKCLAILDRQGAIRHPTYALVLSNLAIDVAKSGDLPRALDLTDQVIAIDVAAIRAAYVMGAQRSRLGLAGRLRAQLLVYVAIMAASGVPDGPLVSRAWSAVLRYKAQEYELEAALAVAVREQETSEFARAVTTIRELELQVATSQARAAHEGHDQDATVGELLSRIDELTLHAWQESPLGTMASLDAEISEDTLAAALGSREALLEFAIYTPLGEGQPPQLGCFVVRRGHPVRFQAVSAAADISTAVDGFVRGMLAERWENQFTPAQLALREALRQAVLEPVLPWLDDVDHLIVCGEGGVERLPFDLLGGADGSSPDAWTVAYASVGRDLLHRSPRPIQGSGAVFAAPDYSGSSASPAAESSSLESSPLRELRESRRLFRDLQGSRAEGEQVARLTGAELYEGQRASKDAMRSLASPAFLHIATHGYYRPMDTADTMTPMVSLLDHPMYRCGLALAHADAFWDSSDRWNLDGIVTGADAAQLQLSGTQFVVISACDSAAGEAQIGEGVFGLHRAFLIAGAGSVIACLWPVGDRAARRLIEIFYRELINGKCVRDALHDARVARRVAGTPTADWAAFVCFGDGTVGLLKNATNRA